MLSPAKPQKTLLNGKDNPFYEQEMETYKQALKDKEKNPHNWGVANAPTLGAVGHQNLTPAQELIKRERKELEDLRASHESLVSKVDELTETNTRLNAAMEQSADAAKMNALLAELEDLRAAVSAAAGSSTQDANRSQAIITGVAHQVFQEYDIKKFKPKAGLVAGFAGLETVTEEELAAAMAAIKGTPAKG